EIFRLSVFIRLPRFRAVAGVLPAGPSGSDSSVLVRAQSTPISSGRQPSDESRRDMYETSDSSFLRRLDIKRLPQVLRPPLLERIDCSVGRLNVGDGWLLEPSATE